MPDLIPITFKATEEFSDWMCRQYSYGSVCVLLRRC